MNKPKVSIIIPAYNASEYIKNCLDSCIKQDHDNVEIIVIDDGSTDNTRDIVKSYSDRRIKYLYKENGGSASARNLGIRNSSGDYIIFLDSDDLILPNRITAHIKSLQNKDKIITYSDFRYIKNHNNNNEYKHKFKFYSGDVLDKMLYKNFIPTNCATYPRSFIDDIGIFNEEIRNCEDTEFLIRALLAGYKVEYLDKVLAYYRLHEGSKSKEKVKNYSNYIKILKLFENKIDKKLLNRAIAYNECNIGRYLIKSGEFKKGMSYIKKSFKHLPPNIHLGLIYIFLYKIFGVQFINYISNIINVNINLENE